MEISEFESVEEYVNFVLEEILRKINKGWMDGLNDCS